MSFTDVIDTMDPMSKVDRLMGVLMSLHPAYVEALIDALDEYLDFRTVLCQAYEREWPSRAEHLFHGEES